MIALSPCCDCFKVASMTTPATRKRVTVIASQAGVESAERSLIRQGFETKGNFAKFLIMGKSTVDNFFNRKGIQPDSFKRICNGLKLNWKDIMEQGLIVNPVTVDSPALSGFSTSSGLVFGSPGALNEESICSINTVDGINTETRLVLVLEGDFNSINNESKQAIEILLRNGFGSTIKVTDIQSGSIRITIQGDKKDVAKLVDRFTSGQLKEVNGLAVEENQILSPDFLEETKGLIYPKKWELVQDIVTNQMRDRQLVNADLSDADLSNVNLSGADLSGADLSGADLRSADLRSADFNRADLSRSDLSRADLRSLTHRDLVFDHDLDFDLALTQAHDLDLALTQALALIPDHARALACVLTQARARARAYARALARALARAHSRAHFHFHARARARAYALAFTLALTLIFTLALAYAFPLTLALTYAFILALLLTQVLTFARDLAFALALDRTLVRGRVVARTLSSARACALNLDLDFNLNLILLGANLSNANLSNANLSNAQLGSGLGLSQSEKLDLARRGAIFDKAPGDRSPISFPFPVRR
jgi:uncharacterized protein YjbI with pentapeptide repeats